MIGIYEILNLQNGKRYVGSSSNIKRRWSKHKSCLRGNYHQNSHLQNAWNKYGEEAFEFNILELCNIDSIQEREQEHANIKSDYNIREITESNRGLTPWNKGKKGVQTAWNKGVPCSEETKQKLSEAASVPYSEERKEALKKLFKDNKLTPWNKGKKGVQTAWNKGVPCSEEKKDNLRKANNIAILQLDVNGKIVNSFESIKIASEETGISNISYACKNELKRGGYFWKKQF